MLDKFPIIGVVWIWFAVAGYHAVLCVPFIMYLLFRRFLIFKTCFLLYRILSLAIRRTTYKFHWVVVEHSLAAKIFSWRILFLSVINARLLVLILFRSSKKAKNLTDFTPLTVSLELFSVSRKLFLSVIATDIIAFQKSQEKQVIKSHLTE